VLYFRNKFKEVINMAGDLKNRVHYGVTVDKILVAKLRKFSESTKIPQSKIIDEAIEDYLKKHEKEG